MVLVSRYCNQPYSSISTVRRMTSGGRTVCQRQRRTYPTRTLHLLELCLEPKSDAVEEPMPV